MPAPLQIFEHTTAIAADDIKGGHVHNSRFFAYIGNACDEWYRALGFTVDSDSGIGGAPAIAHISNDFLRQLTYPGSVLCRLTVVRVGKTSLEQAVELCDADSPEIICARGKIIHVWIDQRLGKPAVWPESVVGRCWGSEK